MCTTCTDLPYSSVGCDHTIAGLDFLTMNNSCNYTEATQKYNSGLEHGYNLCVSYAWSVYGPVDLVLDDLALVSVRRPPGVIELQAIRKAAMSRPVHIRWQNIRPAEESTFGTTGGHAWATSAGCRTVFRVLSRHNKVRRESVPNPPERVLMKRPEPLLFLNRRPEQNRRLPHSITCNLTCTVYVAWV